MPYIVTTYNTTPEVGPSGELFRLNFQFQYLWPIAYGLWLMAKILLSAKPKAHTCLCRQAGLPDFVQGVNSIWDQ